MTQARRTQLALALRSPPASVTHHRNRDNRNNNNNNNNKNNNCVLVAYGDDDGGGRTPETPPVISAQLAGSLDFLLAFKARARPTRTQLLVMT